MLIHLWHYTTPANVKLIRSQGFSSPRELNRPGSYFCLAGEPFFRGNLDGLVEVWLNIDDCELRSFAFSQRHGGRLIPMFCIPTSRIEECAVRWCFHYDLRAVPLDHLRSVPWL